MADTNTKFAVVIGAGIIGLTTALRLQQKGGFHVTVLAETFPTDPKTIRYTSHWAGAHHVSHAGDDERWQKMDKETFDVMWAHSAPGHPASHCFHRHPQTGFSSAADETRVKWLEHMPEFRYLTPDELVPGATLGYTFHTVTITPPLYLSYLFSRFLANNGAIVRASLHHIDQVIEEGITPFTQARTPVTTTPTGANPNHGGTPRDIDALFVCAGLNARFLGGVEDKHVFPIRGQTVLLRAPWVRFGKSFEERDGTYTYVMPRNNGDVLLGGTKTPNDWSPTPREETTTDILTRALALVPELAPPSIINPTVDDLRPLIIDVGCGLRPAREGGIRVEVERVESSRRGRKIPVVFNYGHAGYGYISSWGSASVAVGLLEKALQDSFTG
ncbi:hypothetical protein BU15DRAFT_74692 [Melanogaster broomeanus]|nr:hypothetical protein BU15DRAFT_74692 [Melanogaster broomeanus]